MLPPVPPFIPPPPPPPVLAKPEGALPAPPVAEQFRKEIFDKVTFALLGDPSTNTAPPAPSAPPAAPSVPPAPPVTAELNVKLEISTVPWATLNPPKVPRI